MKAARAGERGRGRCRLPRYGSWVSMARRDPLAGQLAVLGFADTARAEQLLAEDLGFDVGGRGRRACRRHRRRRPIRIWLSRPWPGWQLDRRAA